MKSGRFFLLLAFLLCASGFAQDDSALLKTIAKHYYRNEKPIVKGRSQLLFLYCEKANNNEEIFETINHLKLPPAEAKHLKNQVTANTAPENWTTALEGIGTSGETYLLQKINKCLSLEEFQAKQKKSNLNHQRLMIVSKPVFWPDGKTALVKVVFYRSIEHNNGAVLLMKKNADNNWEIKEFLNSWET